MRSHVLTCLLAVLACASLVSVAQATDRYVPSVYGVIDDAIAAATSGSDRVVITDPTLSGDPYDAFTLNKDVDILSDSEEAIEIAPGCQITHPGGTVSGVTFKAGASFGSFLNVGRGTVSNCAFVDGGYAFSSAAVAYADTGAVITDCTFTLTSGRAPAIDVLRSTNADKVRIEYNSIAIAISTAE